MCDSCGWEDALGQIDELLGNPDYEFAEDTLSGIKDWVEEKSHITNRQQEAIDNIEQSKNR